MFNEREEANERLSQDTADGKPSFIDLSHISSQSSKLSDAQSHVARPILDANGDLSVFL